MFMLLMSHATYYLVIIVCVNTMMSDYGHDLRFSSLVYSIMNIYPDTTMAFFDMGTMLVSFHMPEYHQNADY